MNAYAKIVIRLNFTKKDGSNPICLRLTIGGKPKYFSLNVSVKPEFWDPKKLLARKSCPNSYNINLIIQNAISRAEKIIFDYTIQSKPLSAGEFERIFKTPEMKGNSFYEYADRVVKESEVKFSFYTIKTLKSHIRKFKGFSPELSLADLSLSFIKAYDTYMIGKNNSENTRFKSMAVLKSFINKAIKDGLMKENPFKLYPISKKAGHREHLSIEELRVLEEYYHKDIPAHLKNTLKYFLFSCYTGLRYQDIQKLVYSELSEGMVALRMHKTKDIVNVPLIEKSKHLIGTGFNNQRVFKVSANQVANRNLKDIMTGAGIKKDISFHCARHTFATVGISLGIPIEVISKLLGHKDLQTTQIYAKVMDHVKIKEMGKWNDI